MPETIVVIGTSTHIQTLATNIMQAESKAHYEHMGFVASTASLINTKEVAIEVSGEHSPLSRAIINHHNIEEIQDLFMQSEQLEQLFYFEIIVYYADQSNKIYNFRRLTVLDLAILFDNLEVCQNIRAYASTELFQQLLAHRFNQHTFNHTYWLKTTHLIEAISNQHIKTALIDAAPIISNANLSHVMHAATSLFSLEGLGTALDPIAKSSTTRSEAAPSKKLKTHKHG